MNDRTQYLLALFVAGFAWFAAIRVWRFFSLEHSRRMFWLHLTAPIIGSVLMVVGLILVVLVLSRQQP